MKVVAQKIFVANASRTNFVFVKLKTDEGIEGVGEATLEWKARSIVGALEDLERFIVGKDPFQVEHLIETMHRDSYWRTGAVFRSALKWRDRGGAARHQGQGFGRPGLRAFGRQASRSAEMLR